MEYIAEHPKECISVLVVVLLLILVLSIFARLFRVALCIAVLAVVIPVMVTIFWGDGTQYVEAFSSLLQPKYEQQVNDAYAYFKEKDTQDPFVDAEQVTQTVTDVFASTDAGSR